VNGENNVTQSNALIEAKGSMTALERKLFASVVSEIRMSDEDQTIFELNISEFRELTGLHNNYSDLKTACEGLMSKVITIEKELDGKGKRKKFLMASYLSAAEHVEGANTLRLEISKMLKPYLFELSIYTEYQLKNILAMKSGHSIKIYELLKQYKNMYGKNSREFQLQELKELLGVGNKYKVFKDFDKNVLKVAEKEISELTDIVVTYDKIKRGRPIDKIVFSWTEKPQQEEELTEVGEMLQTDLRSPLIESAKQLRELLGLPASFNDEQILELYDLADKRSKKLDGFTYFRLNWEYTQMKKTQSPRAYLEKALKNDFAKAYKYKPKSDEE